MTGILHNKAFYTKGQATRPVLSYKTSIHSGGTSLDGRQQPTALDGVTPFDFDGSDCAVHASGDGSPHLHGLDGHQRLVLLLPVAHHIVETVRLKPDLSLQSLKQSLGKTKHRHK